jgi:hypothetical protein
MALQSEVESRLAVWRHRFESRVLLARLLLVCDAIPRSVKGHVGRSLDN